MAALAQPLPVSPLRSLPPWSHADYHSDMMQDTGPWGHSQTRMFAMRDSPRPASGNAGLPHLAFCRVTMSPSKRKFPNSTAPLPLFKRQKVESEEERINTAFQLSPKGQLLCSQGFSTMNPAPRTPNRNRRKRKSLPSTSGWEGYPKLEDMQSQTSPPPPPPITPVKMNKPSLKTPPTKGSAKKKEALSHEECWSISQRLFKHFGTEAMPAKTMLNRYLRNRVGRPKQDVLMALEKEVGPTVTRVRWTPGKKRPAQKKAPGPSRFLREKQEQDELLMYAQM